MASGIKDNTTLTELFMTHNDLSGSNGEIFVMSLGGKLNIKSLALNNCKINNKLIEKLAEVMQGVDNLKELYLYSNKLGPQDAIHISKILENKRKLTALGLSNNQIGIEGAV